MFKPSTRPLFFVLLALGSCATATPVPEVEVSPPSPAPPLPVTPSSGVESPHPGAEPAPEPESSARNAGTSPESADDLGSERTLGWIAGMPLTADQLLEEWYQVAGREVWLLVDKLVATRLAFAEAQRLGLRLVPETVVERTALEREELEAEVRAEAPGLALEEFIRRELDMEPKVYFDRVRAGTIRQMLAERVVRAWTLSNENATVRLIVVPDDAGAAEVSAALANGVDFAALARQHSIDDTAARGGLVPHVIRQEHAPLARVTFQTEPGEVAGPLESAEHRFFVRVEERRAPIEGSWKAVGPVVEQSLKVHPVDDAEFVHWKIAMEERYPIDLTPLMELVGAPR